MQVEGGLTVSLMLTTGRWRATTLGACRANCDGRNASAGTTSPKAAPRHASLCAITRAQARVVVVQVARIATQVRWTTAVRLRTRHGIRADPCYINMVSRLGGSGWCNASSRDRSRDRPLVSVFHSRSAAQQQCARAYHPRSSIIHRSYQFNVKLPTHEATAAKLAENGVTSSAAGTTQRRASGGGRSRASSYAVANWQVHGLCQLGPEERSRVKRARPCTRRPTWTSDINFNSLTNLQQRPVRVVKARRRPREPFDTRGSTSLILNDYDLVWWSYSPPPRSSPFYTSFGDLVKL